MTAGPEERRDQQVERLLLILMAARLVLAMSGLVIGLILDLASLDEESGAWNPFYAIVALLFVATVIYRPFLGRIERPRFFAALNMVTDMLLVSGLVVFSGGIHSVFTFCYVVVGLYGGLLFPGWGAVLSAVSGAAAYGAVLAAGQQGWLGPGVAPEPVGVVWTSFATHVAALLGSAALSGFLARELARTGEALDERTQDLAALRRLHEHTVESLRSGLLTADLEGRITSFNREAERITGWTRARAVGRLAGEVIPGLPERLGCAGDREPPNRFRMQYAPVGRDLMHLGFGVYALRDAESAACGAVVIFQDVTGVVAMEQELRRSERLAAVGELSASIAHEIRNPLAAISGSVQTMNSMEEASPEEARRLREIVVREVDRLDQLIHDFLQFARPGEPRLAPIAVAEVVDEVIAMAEGAREPGVRIECAVEPGLGLLADAAQLRQVLWNLLRNACQAMPDGGVVRIEARSARGRPQGGAAPGRIEEQAKPVWAEIAVLDQGTGVPAEVAEHMFDPFFTTKANGSGLGLAIVHRVVGEHGGSVRVQAGRDGFATAIRLTLPRAEITS